MMKREKSCGVLVLRQQVDELYVVLLRHRFGGHWSFPKGHVEAGESERQTAHIVTTSGKVEPREIRTGISDRLRVEIIDGVNEGDHLLIGPANGNGG